MPRWLKIIFKTLGVIIGLVVIAIIAVSVYINLNKKSILADITKLLNQNINGGSLSIQSMNPTFFSDLPRISLSLKNVSLKDSLWKVHHHTLLEAQELSISVNTFALFKGTIEIYKVGINKANIYLYTDSTGYTNTAVFKKQDVPKNIDKNSSGSSTKIKRISLNDVKFVLDNQKGHKLFNFDANELNGKIDYLSEGWKANVRLKVLANSLAFNTLRGSFIKNKLVQGDIDASYNAESGVITLAKKTLTIGDDNFLIGAKFDTKKNGGNFVFDITEKSLLWKHAAALLAPNIAAHLNIFDLKNPLEVHALIGGNFESSGDPSLNISCNVDNNTLTTPGGKVDSISFHGVFTNSFVKGKALSDENSAIELFNLKGNYAGIPFKVDTGVISNLKAPIASGTFKSDFAVEKLNTLFGESLDFNAGTASLNIKYNANIVNFKLVKPVIKGVVDIKNASVTYVPRKINFKNTSILMDFRGDDLLLKNIRLQSGKSIVTMEGSIKNFLNLYYSAPEKIVVDWQIHSPQLYLGEFLGFLTEKSKIKVKKNNGKSSFADQLNTVLAKSQANMHLLVDKAYYRRFLATDVVADLLVSENGINIKNVFLKNAGGRVRLNGSLAPTDNSNHFDVFADVNNVNISTFFYSFNDFGLKGVSYKNLHGFLFLKSKFSGNITDEGTIVPRSINGKVDLDIKKGALINFTPITDVAMFAFPFRNVDNITFENLKGQFDIQREKIIIHPMLINSSVLNMNVKGVYSLGKGTRIELDVPLRNPKKDDDITSKKEKRERRMKGIVLHILASDGKDGKVKIGWNTEDHPIF